VGACGSTSVMRPSCSLLLTRCSLLRWRCREREREIESSAVLDVDNVQKTANRIPALSQFALLTDFVLHSFKINRRTTEKAVGTCLTLASFLAYSSILKMEAICSSETSVYFQQIIRRCIAEDRILRNHSCENFKSFY
jgi:hypothetical protein